MAGTIVWLAQALTSLACICSFSETTGTLPSALTGTYGVLGVYERSLVAGDGSSATLLTPALHDLASCRWMNESPWFDAYTCAGDTFDARRHGSAITN